MYLCTCWRIIAMHCWAIHNVQNVYRMVTYFGRFFMVGHWILKTYWFIGLLVYLHDQTGYTTNNCLVSCRISSWWTPMIKSKTSSFCTFTHQTFHRGHFLCMVHNNIVLPVSLSWSLMQRLWWLQMMMRSDCIYLYFVGRDRRPPSEIGLK